MHWTAPAECPTQASIESQIEHAIGRTLLEVYGVDFDATIERHNGRTWTLALQTHARTPEGEVRTRELTGATCAEVSDAAVLAMTLAISERTSARSGDEESEPWKESGEPVSRPHEPTRVPPAQAEPTEDSPPPSAATPVPLDFSAGIVGVLDTALLPSLAEGVSLEFAIRYGLFKAILLAELFAEQETRLSDGRGGRFSLAAGGGLLCLQPSAEGLWMLGCAGVEIGRLSAEGILDTPLRDGTTLRAVRVEVGGGYRASERISVIVRFGISAPLFSTDFNVDKDDLVHRLGPVSGRVVAGLELYL